jgi:phenylacetate-CoA ligase
MSYKYKKSLKIYNDLKEREQLPIEELQTQQIKQLKKILYYASENVPYYKQILKNNNIIVNGEIQLETLGDYQHIPLLTKEIIRQEGESLYSVNHQSRGSFENSSGGSTGEPTRFIQDINYLDHSHANIFLLKSWRGVDPFESTVYVWGAERDTFTGKKPFKHYIRDFILNINILNSFKMNAKIITNIISVLNRNKPKLIVAYAQSIYEIAKYAKQQNLSVSTQNAIQTGASTLYDFMRKEIEDVFKCKVFNHYGSREVGAIASECFTQNGLHILMDNVLIEIVDENGKPVENGEEGELVVTTLNNFSMPLIRYKIGDIGSISSYAPCSCGCNYPKLSNIAGRSIEVFKTLNGDIITPEYFIHLIGVVCNDNSIKTFQVIQKELDFIEIKIVKSMPVDKKILQEIEEKVKIVMGENCKIEYNFVKEIPKSPTGKYLYTISELN